MILHFALDTNAFFHHNSNNLKPCRANNFEDSQNFLSSSLLTAHDSRPKGVPSARRKRMNKLDFSVTKE